ncbi:MAG: branched-chain amino acid ABC transporter permease [Deltaproteobacteria bacterium]|nr:branched-chain amino acid ABC transporter permease [Deltaproteobacteria bacterium]MBW2082145.1 branched-chain amino acid ABC transporter permease [Deltaproteobacteria bacterium]RLB85890.1 MAG: branched-chain amino acid ABC transporter permease [Deltaproteobacteria bacterium]HDM09831.1 branched-chain amino acid ABC transporter permease [Desulfobacteraceae bacterium]
MRRLQFHPCGNFRESYHQELTIFETDFGRLWLIVGLVLLFGVVPFVSTSYLLYVLNLMGIYAIAAIGLNILIGYTGQISLGHGAFFGVGAYTAAILATRVNFPFWAAVPLGGMATAGVGMIFGIPSGRLKHLYLTIATLAGQFIMEYVFVHWDSLTGGADGIVVTGATLFGIDLGNDRSFFFVIFVCFVIMTWIAVNLMRTRYGRAFIAIRDNDRAAEGMGIPLFRYKLLSFAISSFYAGFAGGLFAYYTMSITPEPFNLWLSIEFIAMIIIGGLGNIPGSVFGTIFIVALNESLSALSQYLMNLGTASNIAITIAPLREFVFGMAIILFIIFEPKGLAEVWRIIRSSFRLWPFSY